MLGKARQKAMRERARAFLEVLKPLLPLKASKVKELANKGAIPLWLMYEQRKGASIDLALQAGVSYWRLPGQRLPTVPTDSESPTNGEAPAEAAPANGAAAAETPLSQPNGTPTASPNNRGRGGRPTNPTTQRVYEFCYTGYIQNGLSRARVLDMAVKEFGPDDAPKYEADVRLYAKRWAKSFTSPKVP